MTALKSQSKAATAEIEAGSSSDFRRKKTQLRLKWRDISIPLCFLLSMSLTGLLFYPAFLITCILLINRFKKCREEFILMITILISDFGMLPDDIFPVRIRDIMLVVSLLALFFVRKNRMTRRVAWLWLGYLIFACVIASLSDEVMSIQFLTMRQYLSVIYFTIPLWVFANKYFDIHLFFKKVVIYFLILASFHVIDGFIISGYVLLPSTSHVGMPSTIQSLIMKPFTTYFPRKYPSAFYIAIVAAYPLARYYKLVWWQWAIIAVAFAATRTMSFVGAFVITYVIFQGNFKTFMKYFVLSIFGLVALYMVDEATGGFMRISSTVDQFASVMLAEDDEDLAEFGTGRMAQIIPKYEALRDQHCLAQGFGFIHPDKTTNPKYIIKNELYSDISQSEEVAAITEVTQFNTVIHTGIIGLLVQAFFYIYIYFVIGGKRSGSFYMSSLIAASIMGIGGFAGLNYSSGLAWVALALGVCLVMQRPRQRTAGEPTYF